MTASNPEKKRALNQIWWQLAVFVAISTLAVFVGVSLKEKVAPYIPEEETFRSTFNARPSGYKGLNELTDRIGIQSEKWQLPYRRLRKETGILVVIEPDQSLADFEVDEILSWVKAGNKLVVMDNFAFSFQRRLPEKLDLTFTAVKPQKESFTETKGSDRLLAHVARIVGASKRRIKGGQPVLSDTSGAIFTESAYGKGKVIVGTAPGLCSNRMLGDKKAWSNFQFMENLFHYLEGKVWFDETCHGFIKAKNVFFYLGKGAVGLVFFQLVLVFGLLLASSSQRFGKTRTVQPLKRTSNLEYIEGLANTYRSARATELAWEILSHSLVARLNRALGVSADSDYQKLCQAWSDATHQPADELNSFLNKSDAALGGKEISETELVELTAAYDKITEKSREILTTKRGSIG